MKNKFVTLIIVVLFLIGLSGCDDLAKNRIVKKIDSPDKKYTAIAFVRDAGATTDFSPQVSILKKGEVLGNESGNVFIGNNSESIDIKWKNKWTLIVYCSIPSQDIYKQIKKYKKLKVKYE